VDELEGTRNNTLKGKG